MRFPAFLYRPSPQQHITFKVPSEHEEESAIVFIRTSLPAYETPPAAHACVPARERPDQEALCMHTSQSAYDTNPPSCAITTSLPPPPPSLTSIL